jgi:hypothetical protein
VTMIRLTGKILMGTWAVTIAVLVCCSSGNTNKDSSMAEQRGELEKAVNRTIRQIDTQIDELEKSLPGAGEDRAPRLRFLISALRDMKTKLGNELPKINTIGKEEWSEFKSETDGLIKDAAVTLRDIKAELESPMGMPHDQQTR